MAKSQQQEYILHDSLLNNIPGVESFQSKSKLDPDRAAFYSAVLPGLGQIYNKQYWKLPFIYGGMIAIGHAVKYNNDRYNAFRNAYLIADQIESDGDGSSGIENPYPYFNKSSLQRRAEKFQRDRDFMVIIGAVFYLLNIVDAHVSAHLIEFEINEDLSFRPTYQPQSEHFTQNLGMSLVLQLNK